MKFTVNVLGADQSLIGRLVAAADRRLAPKLAEMASASNAATQTDAVTPASTAAAARQHDGTDTAASGAADGTDL